MAHLSQENNQTLDRRSALKSIAIMAGYALTASASAAFLHGCKADTSADWTPKYLNDETSSLLAEVCERIIPKTETPGAKDALVHRYIDEALGFSFSEDDRASFITEVQKFDTVAREKYKKKFVDLTDDKKDDVLKILAAEWKAATDQKHIFKSVRDLTITGYTTSEVGAKGHFFYDPIPGPYQGCIPFDTVGKVYAL